MSKESDRLFYQSIGNSIQANKDKIEKLEKQVDRLKKKNKELTKYKERNETLLDIIRYYKTTEWGLKSCEILDNFEEILEDKEKR